MIDIRKKQENEFVWVLEKDIGSMIFPKKVKFHSLESPYSDKLAYVIMGNKVICYPTSLIFENKLDAEIYASTKILKLYNNDDVNFKFDTEQGKKILDHAEKIIELYVCLYPDKFLYYWMSDACN